MYITSCSYVYHYMTVYHIYYMDIDISLNLSFLYDYVINKLYLPFFYYVDESWFSEHFFVFFFILLYS